MAETMRAIQVRTPGGPDALEAVELAIPACGPGQVRVKASAIGAGGPDVLIRKGIYKWMPPLPAIPGNEMVGVIEAVGEGVASSLLGRRVLVSSRELPERGGCYAEIKAGRELNLGQGENPELGECGSRGSARRRWGAALWGTARHPRSGRNYLEVTVKPCSVAYWAMRSCQALKPSRMLVLPAMAWPTVSL